MDEFRKVRLFLEEVNKVESIKSLEALIAPLLAEFGIRHYICTNIYGFSPLPDMKPFFGTWDSGWVQHYIQCGLFRDDAVTVYSNGLENDGRPYYWSDIAAIKGLTEAQRKVMAEAWDADLHEGLVIPLRVSDDEFAMASMGGRDLKRDPIIQGILHTVSIQAHRMARILLLREANSLEKGSFLPNRLPQSPKPKVEKVTEAEREVLRWLAADLGPGEIATIRKRSLNTINKQLSSIRSKLIVDTNAGAVTVARNYRLIN